MIKTKKDYGFYLEADRVALGKNYRRPSLFGDEIWRFQRLLRKVEFYTNCRKSLFWKLNYYYSVLRFYQLSVKLGFTIHPNNFGPGLSIAHRGTIVINPAARIGSNCRIHACVNIGTKAGHGNSAPTLGNNIYIGPGATIFGDIEIADGIAIGANSVVNKSFPEAGISIAGTPAKKINESGSEGLLIKATEVLESKT